VTDFLDLLFRGVYAGQRLAAANLWMKHGSARAAGWENWPLEGEEGMSTSIRFDGRILVFTCLLCTCSWANEAVSTTNFKAEGFYGSIDGQTAQGIGASASFPLWSSSGVQVDGLGGKINPDDLYGVGLHAFWRDASVGLLGLNTTYTRLDKTGVPRVSLEGECYLGRFTVAAYGGYQSGDIDSSGYGALQGRYYILDDLMASAGAATSDGCERYALGIEYQTPVHGLSLFASLAKGEEHYDHAFIGLRFYFGGESKPLIRRHRENDPANNLFENVLDTFMALRASESDRSPGGGYR
jgi:hypothetical protein